MNLDLGLDLDLDLDVVMGWYTQRYLRTSYDHNSGTCHQSDNSFLSSPFVVKELIN